MWRLSCGIYPGKIPQLYVMSIVVMSVNFDKLVTFKECCDLPQFNNMIII